MLPMDKCTQDNMQSADVGHRGRVEGVGLKREHCSEVGRRWGEGGASTTFNNLERPHVVS